MLKLADTRLVSVEPAQLNGRACKPLADCLDLAIVLPTFNERANINALVQRLEDSLAGLHWEAVFVDDDSPDGTSEAVLSIARQHPHIRLIQRIGRRGLASACIEGMLATSAGIVAVMDADGQHDPSALPAMLHRLKSESLDLVIGTRNAEGGSMGSFGTTRLRLSRLGRSLSRMICRCDVTDPMSGFFLLRRSFLMEVVHDLRPAGFKILVDMLASSPRKVKLGEVGYTFGVRVHGRSKLDAIVAFEYARFLLGKLITLSLWKSISAYSGGSAKAKLR